MRYTKEDILIKLATDARWVERAIQVLYENRQVPIEKAAMQTVRHNDIGFQPADARMFSSFAMQIAAKAKRGVPAGQRLSEKQLNYARRPWGRRGIPAIAKYRGQILELIEERKQTQ